MCIRDSEKRVLVENPLVDHEPANRLGLGLREVGEVFRTGLVDVSVLDENLKYLIHTRELYHIHAFLCVKEPRASLSARRERFHS